MGWKRLLNQLIQNHQKRNRMPDELKNIIFSSPGPQAD
jgi:hypothetical protein